jgi:exopolysaccharide synthesis protein ExoD
MVDGAPAKAILWPHYAFARDSGGRTRNFYFRGLLLLIPAVQMLAGRSAPIFPRWIADRPLPTKHLGTVVVRAISVLKYLEKVVRPRFPTPPELTKR